MWIEMEKLQEVLSVENLICLAFLLGISVYDIYFHRISKAVLVLANLLAAFHTLYTLTMAEGRLGRADEMDLIWAAAGAGAGLLYWESPGSQGRLWDTGMAGWSWLWGSTWGFGDLWRCSLPPGCCWLLLRQCAWSKRSGPARQSCP